jgi:hypothetical protein
LIDQYVHGELPNPKQFEEYFLSSPSRLRKVEFARALMRSSATHGRQPSWWVSIATLLGGKPRVWLPVAATLVIVAGVSLLLMNWQKLNAPDPVAQQQQSPAQNTAPPQPPTPVRVAAFVLTPSLTRSADETLTLTIERDTEVHLELHLEAVDYGSYRAVLRTVEGKEIWSQDRLRPERTASGQAVVVRVPTSRFSDEDYTARLSGVSSSGELEDVSSYYFRVKTK